MEVLGHVSFMPSAYWLDELMSEEMKASLMHTHVSHKESIPALLFIEMGFDLSLQQKTLA